MPDHPRSNARIQILADLFQAQIASEHRPLLFPRVEKLVQFGHRERCSVFCRDVVERHEPIAANVSKHSMFTIAHIIDEARPSDKAATSSLDAVLILVNLFAGNFLPES